MKTACDEGKISLDTVLQIIEGRDPRDRDDLQLIGTISTPDQLGSGGVHLQHFEYAVPEVMLGNVGVYAGGTGADDLLEIIPQVISASPIPNCEPGSAEHFDWAIAGGIGNIREFCWA